MRALRHVHREGGLPAAGGVIGRGARPEPPVDAGDNGAAARQPPLTLPATEPPGQHEQGEEHDQEPARVDHQPDPPPATPSTAGGRIAQSAKVSSLRKQEE